MTMLRPSYSTRHEHRVRRSRRSEDVHTRQPQPMTGIPVDVPVPRSVTRMDSALFILAVVRRYGCSATPDFLQRASHRSEEHTSELQSRENLVCRLLLEKKKHR